jgi:hypothetical protein
LPSVSAQARQILFATALFIFVLGARWLLIGAFGMDLPEMDQWDAEAREILQPWYGDHHSLANLFRAHNEHRIAPTRLAALALTAMNRQWDQRLESVMNAFLPAAVATAMWLAAAHRYRRSAALSLGLLLAIAWGGAFAWENTIHGFESQQWFLILFALGAMVCLPFAEPFRARWWWGAGCAAVSLVTMGSGVLAACACAAIVGLRWWRNEVPPRSALVTLSVCLALAALGWSLRVDFPGHHALYARSLKMFWRSMSVDAGWPGFGAHPGYAAVLLWLPWIWSAAGCLRKCARPEATHECWIGIGLWALLQIGATAYARGATPPPPAPRYLDNFLVGILANGFCLAELLIASRRAPRARLALRAVLAAWAVMLGAGFLHQSLAVVPGQLAALPQFDYYCQANVRNFLATGNFAYLNHREIPYPNARALADAISLPAVRELLPASVRLPLALSTVRSAGFFAIDTRGRQRELPRLSGDGLPPSSVPLENSRFFGCYSAAPLREHFLWQSGTLVSQERGWLQFRVSGNLGRPGTSLALYSVKTGRLLARVVPVRVPGNGWHNAYVTAPREPFFIRARDDSPGTWFAFAEPVEMGSLSFWAGRAVRHVPYLMLIGGGLILGLLALTLPRDMNCDRIIRTE